MSLLAPLYLLGLLGLFLPWLLHRFNHHEPPVQPFPSTRFLEPTRPPATSKRKLRYWSLLALRVLLLAGLCFLFAQPWLQSDENANDADAVRMLIVDNSFSMRAGDKWALANDAIDTVLSDLPEKNAVQLFSFSTQLSALTDITNDRTSVKDALALLEPGFESADYGDLMRRVDKLVGDMDIPVTAYFITDAQRSNLPAQMNTLLADSLKSFNVLAVGASDETNYFLSADATSSDSVTARVVVNVSASAPNAGTELAATQKNIDVLLKDQLVASEQVLLEPGEIKTVQFDSISLPSEPGELLQVQFRQTDYFSDDDKLSIPVRGLSQLEFSVSQIGGEPSAQAQVFVTTALETNGSAKVSMLDIGAALAPGMRHAVIFVDDITKVPDAVTRFINSGGNALLIPNRIDQLANSTALSVSSKAAFVSRVDEAHPLGLSDLNWFDTRFYDTGTFDLQSSDRVLLGLDTGNPVLIERSVADNGRLLILNDVLDGVDTDLPLQPVYVSLMQRIVEYFDISNAIPAQIEVGHSLFLPANSQLLSPDGEAMLDLAQLGSTNDVRIEQPGVYSVLGASQSNTVLAVLNPAESNLSALTRTELDAWEARHNQETLTSDDGANDTDTTVANDVTSNVSNALNSAQNRHALWRWLLPLVLLFLIAESLFANRMLWIRRDGL